MRSTWLQGLMLIGLVAISLAQTQAPPSSKANADAQQWKYFHGSYLGVDIRDLTPDRVAPLKLKSERGVEITMVDQDGPAAKAGLKEHDVILSFNNTPVEGIEPLRRMIRETPPSRTVALGISRDGQPMTVNVQLGQRKHYAVMAPGPGGKPVRVEIPAIQIPALQMDLPQLSLLQFSSQQGLLLEDLTPQLGEFFGVKNGEGVLVRSVEKGSPAEAAGLKAGDVIVKVANDHISCTSDWKRIIREHSSGTVPLGIVREKREQSVSLKLPERKTSDGTIHIEFPAIDVDLDEIAAELGRLESSIERSVRVAQADLDRMLRDMQRAQHERERNRQLQQPED